MQQKTEKGLTKFARPFFASFFLQRKQSFRTQLFWYFYAFMYHNTETGFFSHVSSFVQNRQPFRT
jgi:hypothetical protein